MEEVMPMQLVKNNFKTSIIKLTSIHKRQFACFYEALTSYGKMTLIVEQFISESNQQTEKKIQNQSNLMLIETRNSLLKKGAILCPLIYEQEMIKIRENYFICLTLTEPIQIKRREDLLHARSISVFENLVECAYKIDSTDFQYQLQCYRLQTVVMSFYSCQVFMDFTRVINANRKNSNIESEQSQHFSIFKKELSQMIATLKVGKIAEIIFVKEKTALFNEEALLASCSWFDLAMMFNLLQNEKVTVLREKKVRVCPIGRLQGCVTFEYKNKKYENYNFQEGYRVDGFTELGYQNLKAHFFEDKITYFMSKNKYQTVRKKFNSEQCWIKDDIQFSDLVIVREQISKAEFISFLIGYFKYIEPTLHTIKYHAHENALQIEYMNKVNKIKTAILKFSPKYIVKDQEVCMIIQKGKLKNTIVSLQQMNITDSFLMFLANCDKMLNVSSLDISYCPNITDTGIHSLFASPLCKNIKSLKVCGLPIVDFSAIKFKKQLKELHINECQLQEEEFNISDWKVEKLQAMGVNVNLNFPSTLKVLNLNMQVSLQNLKYFRNLSLTYLKIRLVENRKNISTFFNNLYKQNPIKLFAQGHSGYSLKILDISHSTVKLKQVKPLFMIESLECLVCDEIDKDKFEDVSLPQHIITLSFKGSHISIEQLSSFVEKTSIIIRLNVCNTDVDETSLETFIKSKKYINLLQVQEEQLSLKMLEKKSGVQSLHIHLAKLIRDEHELILNKLFLTQAQTNKQVNFICNQKLESKLIDKIHRFSMFYETHLSKMLATNLNISINSVPMWKLINYEKKIVHSQHITIFNQHSNHHKIKLFPCSAISQAALEVSEIHMETFNVFLHKTISLYPNFLLEICIRSNRVLGKEVIELILKYAGDYLKAIDFRDCIFTFNDVKSDLYEFPILQCVNEGQYQISLTEQDYCQKQLQKILKFFMKLRQHQKIKLSLKAQQVHERDLFYSIIYQILHQYSKHIVSLSIDFKNMKAQNCELFWKQIFALSNLEVLKVVYYNDSILQHQVTLLEGEFKHINQFKLYSLEISSNIPRLLPHHLNFTEMKRLHLDWTGWTITESAMSKLIKHLTSLTHLDLRMGHCQALNSLRKISDAFQKMVNLTHLSLNLESCPLKEQQIFQLLYCLHKNKHLERLELNINNIILSLAQLIKFCELLQKQNKYCHILIYSLQAKKQPLFRDQNELLSKGIEVIYTI